MIKPTRLQAIQLGLAFLAGILDGFLGFAWGYAWRLPFMPDMLGTALAALYMGPFGAFFAAGIASLVEALLIGPSRLVFLPVRLLGALILSYGVRSGRTNEWKSLLLLSSGQGWVLGIASGLVQIIAFQGFNGEPLNDLLSAVAVMALPTLAAILLVSALGGVIRALINNAIALKLLPGLRSRMRGGRIIALIGTSLALLIVINWPMRLGQVSPLPAPLPMPLLVSSATQDRAPTLAQMHLTAGQQDEALCIDCHEDTLAQSDPPPKHVSPHRLHLDSPLLKFRCTDCHTSVDISQELAGSLRKQVPHTLCISCHQASTHQGLKVYGANICTDCHQDWLEHKQQNKYAASVINLDAITTDDCVACHGNLPLFQPAGGGK